MFHAERLRVGEHSSGIDVPQDLSNAWDDILEKGVAITLP